MRIKTLVLSGGGPKGAYQAGVLHTLAREGFFDEGPPEVIYGVSIGAVNAAYLTALTHSNAPVLSFVRACHRLYQAYEVCDWRCAFHRRSLFALVGDLLRGEWKGIVTLKPLERLIYQEVDFTRLINSPIRCIVGVVSLETGEYRNVKVNDRRTPEKWILASASIPLLMPPVEIDGLHYVDGGLRNIIPYISVFEKPVLVISTHPGVPLRIDVTHFFSLMERVSEIIFDEHIAEDLPSGEGIYVIRPQKKLSVPFLRFSEKDIKRLLWKGETDAMAFLKTL